MEWFSGVFWKFLLALDPGCCCCCWVALVVSGSVRPHRRQPTRLPCLQWEAIFGFLRHYHRLQHPLVDCLAAHHTKSFLPCPVLCIGAANFASEGHRCFSPYSWPELAGRWCSVGISIPPASELVGGGAFPVLLDFFFQWSPIWWRNFYFMVPGYLLGNAIKSNHFHPMKNSEGC